MAPPTQKQYNGLIYDIFLWAWTVILDLFFREIHPRSTWRIPKSGPVIFVAAPHANQFIDPLLLMHVVRHDAHRRIAFLIAEKSMRRAFIGWAASVVNSVPVGRALDSKAKAKGRIYLPDPEGEPTLVKGVGTEFEDKSFMVGGLLVLPSVNNEAANAEIKEIVSDGEIRLKKPFKGDVAVRQLTGRGLRGEGDGDEGGDMKDFEGTKFDVAPHVDQSQVYHAVFKRIREGGCIGIFPEGGSHDRTELLPLKAGLAIMALGALAEDPDCGVSIVPVGMNYFHAHKFRSRAVVEFGAPITIEPELVEMYKNGNRRDAVSKVLEIVYDRLSAVTVQAPDYETLMLIQAVRRLYKPKGKKVPLPYVIELNRRLIKGYTKYKDDPRILELRKSVLEYNRDLFRINIRDHQVANAKLSWYKVLFLTFYRLVKLSILSIAVLPGLILFAPVFISTKIISHRKAKEALAASTVKVRARDVVGTWKILVSLALFPALDIFYTTLLVVWTYTNRIGGLMPDWVSLSLVGFGSFFLFPVICFAALRFGEIGMDIIKSLRPLILSLNPTSDNTLTRLRRRRAELQENVNKIINQLGPELFPDFDSARLIPDPSSSQHARSPDHSRPTTPNHDLDALSFTPASPSATNSQQQVPTIRTQPVASDPPSRAHRLGRNESFANLSGIEVFASRPGTPHRSRSRTSSGANNDFASVFGSGGNKLKGFTSIDAGKSNNYATNAKGEAEAKANLEQVSRNLHEAMKVRRRSRRKSDNGWELAGAEGDEEEVEEEEAREFVEDGEGMSEEEMEGKKGV